MKLRCLSLVLLTAIMLALIAPIVYAQDACPDGQMRINDECADPALASLLPGWNKVEPGGETICAHGTPYAYWIYPGTSNHLLIYMEGGGGCWNAQTCRDTGEEFNGFYDSAVTNSDHPARLGGMMDMHHPDNPFRAYTVLYIPVCTGDVHWGSNTHTYASEAGDVTIHFNGFVNASAALEWAYTNIPQPESVFLTGCSAGSAGSILHAPYVIEQYPDIPVYQLGDSFR